MRLERDTRAETVGFYAGYALSFIIASAILCLILLFTGKTDNPLLAPAIVATVTIAALMIRKWVTS
jgi:hypothetical protein